MTQVQNFIQTILKEQKFRCGVRDCQLYKGIFEYEAYIDHLKSHEQYLKILCPLGCGTLIEKKSMEMHFKPIRMENFFEVSNLGIGSKISEHQCKRMKVKCLNCSLIMEYNLMLGHKCLISKMQDWNRKTIIAHYNYV